MNCEMCGLGERIVGELTQKQGELHLCQGCKEASDRRIKDRESRQKPPVQK